ncbi:hypothetical protein EOD39_4488 [Acipenser ruthenus]|uniref:Uncharacterized protein n=1 Tax=Acipenser ruthenus TaxID=7906 RepID=A0A444UIB9_ACIRT|nr:hypothetical protein EOD39_4488 [Acipenser ruthenus]
MQSRLVHSVHSASVHMVLDAGSKRCTQCAQCLVHSVRWVLCALSMHNTPVSIVPTVRCTRYSVHLVSMVLSALSAHSAPVLGALGTHTVRCTRRRRKGELEQPGQATALGTRATRVEYKSGDKPANEKGCEGESQRTRTLKWSLR